MSKKFTPNSKARWMARTDSASVVGPHTWPIPPPPHPTRDTRKPVRPKTVYSMVSYSYVMLPGVRWYVASPLRDRSLEDRAPRREDREPGADPPTPRPPRSS